MRIVVFFVFLIVAGWFLALPLAISPYLERSAGSWLRDTLSTYTATRDVRSDAVAGGQESNPENLCFRRGNVVWTLPPAARMATPGRVVTTRAPDGPPRQLVPISARSMSLAASEDQSASP